MNKKDYLFQALQTDIWQDAQWLISLMSYTKFDIDPNQQPYSLKYTEDKCYYLHPSNGYIELEGSYNKQGLFVYNERIDLPPMILLNCPQGMKETSIGRIILNLVLLCDAFGEKISYINKRFGIKDIEKILITNLHDTPPEGAERDKEKIYVDEYIRFCNNALFLTQLTQVCVPSFTEKALLPPEGVEEYRAKLVEENKDRLKDPAVAADITQKLVDYDFEQMKDDRSNGFLINKKKDFGIVRKKQFLAIGHETNFEGEGHIDFNARPLYEGIDYKRFDEYVNGARLGSFSRGAETQLGGVAVKELLRVSSNLKVATSDCGTKLGILTHITPEKASYYIGHGYLEGEKTVIITEENVKSLVGKDVHIRSPAYCKVKGAGFCAVCVGPRLSLHKTGLSSAVAAMGSIFLYAFMKSMHGKVVKTTKLDFDNLIT